MTDEDKNKAGIYFEVSPELRKRFRLFTIENGVVMQEVLEKLIMGIIDKDDRIVSFLEDVLGIKIK